MDAALGVDTCDFPNDYGQCIDSIAEFIATEIALLSNGLPFDSAMKMVEEHKYFLNPEYLPEVWFEQPFKKDVLFDHTENGAESNSKVYDLHAQLVEQHQLDSTGASMLQELVSLVELDFATGVNIYTYRRSINNLIANCQYSTVLNEQSTLIVGVVLALSDASIAWWEQHPEAIAPKTRAAVATFVANDVAGALIGGGCAAVGSYILNDGDIQWKSVAWAAGCGAICGSVGAVGKVGSLLRKASSKAWKAVVK